MNTTAHGGKTRIAPMSLAEFVAFITIAKDRSFDNSQILKAYLDSVIEMNQLLDDQVLWSQHINKSISNKSISAWVK